MEIPGPLNYNAVLPMFTLKIKNPCKELIYKGLSLMKVDLGREDSNILLLDLAHVNAYDV